jgi:hyperosmotically inducible protein
MLVALSSTFAVLIAIAGPAGAGGLPDDDMITAGVKRALIDAYLPEARDIEVSTLSGEVTLSGSVASDDRKLLAASVASAVTGVTAIHNRLEVHNRNATSSDADDDAAITARVTSALHGDSDTATQHVHVVTTHGIVQLSGTVDSSSDRDRVEGLVRGVDGVGEIVNRIQVR